LSEIWSSQKSEIWKILHVSINKLHHIDSKVKDILPGKSGYSLNAKVLSKNVLIDIVRLDKTRVVIADFVIGDETGIIKMRLRNGIK
jgi:hypothetical protein